MNHKTEKGAADGEALAIMENLTRQEKGVLLTFPRHPLPVKPVILPTGHTREFCAIVEGKFMRLQLVYKTPRKDNSTQYALSSLGEIVWEAAKQERIEKNK